MNNNYVRPIDVSDALRSLRPGYVWRVINDTTDYDNIVWEDKRPDLPTREEIDAEVSRLQTEYDTNKYQLLRADEYPSLEMLADAIYWQARGNDSKMIEYLELIDAVKSKYPKE